MSKLILADGTSIDIADGSSLSAVQVVSESKEAMIAVWDTLTNDNLATVQVQNDDGTVIGEYTNLVLVSETSTIQSDDSVLTSFRLREKTELELLRERVAALEESEEVHAEAISDLGAAVSEIAGGE